MNRRSLVSAALALSASLASAQAENPYNGKWTLTYDGKKNADLTGTVTIKDGVGSWDVVSQSRKNLCVGREYPIAVEIFNADELTFTVLRAKTLAGCTDSTFRFKKVDDKTLKAELADGRAASLTRD